MAIVASGYLFADELAYHVDVYQGDTASTLLERHAPTASVKNAAVIDIDIPGNTSPLPLSADEPIVVVGQSPRTSVFVYGESAKQEAAEGAKEMQEGEVDDAEPVAATATAGVTADGANAAAADGVVAENGRVKEASAGDGPDAVEMEVEDLTPPPAPSTDDPNSAITADSPNTDTTPPLAETDERPFSRTRRAQKSKANRHTRRISHVPKSLKIELA